jgi:hypothetical protein
VRFGTEDGDAEFVGGSGEDFFDGSHSGHAVADDDEAQARGWYRVHRVAPPALKQGGHGLAAGMRGFILFKVVRSGKMPEARKNCSCNRQMARD